MYSSQSFLICLVVMCSVFYTATAQTLELSMVYKDQVESARIAKSDCYPFISDLYVIVSNTTNIDKQLPPKHWVIENDLNKGAGGKFIFLAGKSDCYNKTLLRFPYNQIITNLYVYSSKYSNNQFQN